MEQTFASPGGLGAAANDGQTGQFNVRIEYFHDGGAGRGVSVRPDSERYTRCAATLQAAITRHFDGHMRAVTVATKTPYALEVSILGAKAARMQGPFSTLESSPRSPAASPRSPATSPRARSNLPNLETQPTVIFSKLALSCWPRVDDVLAEIRKLCHAPTLLKVVRSGGEDEDSGIADSRNFDPLPVVPLGGVKLRLQHPTSGWCVDASTSADGVLEAMLFPGKFLLYCADANACERFDPESIAVQAIAGRHEETVVARRRHRCYFSVADQTGEPASGLQFHVNVAGEDRVDRGRGENHTDVAQCAGLLLKTDAAGRCECLLPEGAYEVTGPMGVADSLLAPFRCPIYVQDSKVRTPSAAPCAPHQSHVYHVGVQRGRFPARVLLTTRGGDKIAGCQYVILQDERKVSEGVTDEGGYAVLDLDIGRYVIRFLPIEGSPLNEAVEEFSISQTGACSLQSVGMDAKVAQVTIFFVTEDGEPAENCRCRIRAAGRDRQTFRDVINIDSGDMGCAVAKLTLLAPYVLEVKEERCDSDYETQSTSFSPRGCAQTLVVKRTLLGRIRESNFLLALDASCPRLRACWSKIAEGIRRALEQRCEDADANGAESRGSRRPPDQNADNSNGDACFGMVAYVPPSQVVQWPPDAPKLVPLTVASATEASDFIDSMCPRSREAEILAMQEAAWADGDIEDPCLALEAAYGHADVEAIYWIVDGGTYIDHEFVRRVKVAFYCHKRRPRLHAILVNGNAKQLQAVSLITGASQRSVYYDLDSPSKRRPHLT